MCVCMCAHIRRYIQTEIERARQRRARTRFSLVEFTCYLTQCQAHESEATTGTNAYRPAQLTLHEAQDEFVRTGLKEINFGTKK